MTEEKQVGWASFGSSVKIEESTFDEQLGGSKFLKPGVYKDVIISAVEPKESKAGNFYVRVRYENEEEAGTNDNIILSGKDKDGEPCLHWIYRRFAGAICDDPALRLRFFGNTLPDNPELFKALIGLKLTVKIKDGDTGYKIDDVATGGKILVDVETGKAFEDTGVYDGYKEAKEDAAEKGIKQCYCEVDQILKPSEEFRASNNAVLLAVLDETNEPVADKPTAKKPPKKKVPVSI